MLRHCVFSLPFHRRTTGSKPSWSLSFIRLRANESCVLIIQFLYQIWRIGLTKCQNKIICVWCSEYRECNIWGNIQWMDVNMENRVSYYEEVKTDIWEEFLQKRWEYVRLRMEVSKLSRCCDLFVLFIMNVTGTCITSSQT